ncbi:MAG: hypothetical protein ACI8WT_003602 [Clostridium sp.]|jgi:hypothetical protein
MNKKIIGSVFAALLIAGSTFLTAVAAMPYGTVVMGDKAFDLGYANDLANVNEISSAIVAGGGVYVKDFSGNWIDNTTGNIVDDGVIPAAVYKNGDSDEIKYKAADGDEIADADVDVEDTFSLGETAIINDSIYGKYELTVYKVEADRARYEFSDIKPAEVYKVTYTYKLLAKAPLTDGLGIYGFDSAFDDTGKSAQDYPNSQVYYPEELKIVGTYCTAETFIAVTNATDKLTLTRDFYTSNGTEFVTFNVPTKKNNVINPPIGTPAGVILPSETYGLGKTVNIVDSLFGTYDFTINKVEAVQERNEFSDIKPAEVYKVTYTYKLLANATSTVGLGIYGFDSTFDNMGRAGQEYPNSQAYYPEELKIIGTYCTAETFIAVMNPTDKLILTRDFYTGTGTDFVTFVIPTK